jgi:hypothetical protein
MLLKAMMIQKPTTQYPKPMPLKATMAKDQTLQPVN